MRLEQKIDEQRTIIDEQADLADDISLKNRGIWILMKGHEIFSPNKPCPENSPLTTVLPHLPLDIPVSYGLCHTRKGRNNPSDEDFDGLENCRDRTFPCLLPFFCLRTFFL